MTEPTIYELSSPGRKGVRFPEPDVPLSKLPAGLVRKDLPLPELSELDVIRHYTHLSTLNYSIDGGFYPLGSCTMKYNPKINEETARLPGFAFTHPLQPAETVQGNLALMYELQEYLKEISGLAAISLQPAAGAHGEFTGVKIMKAYHEANGDTKRTKMLIPDSAHGTNPATSSMSGFDVIPMPSDSRGNVDLTALKELCDDTVVGLMLTNPNTLGLFDENVVEVVEMVHGCGGLIYGDGANLNALLGIARPGDMGFDVMHFNLHKTFSTPHGGGGPGSGPVVLSEALSPFGPLPFITRTDDGSVRLVEEENAGEEHPQAFGRMAAFHGQMGMFTRALAYILSHGADGLKQVAEDAVLNANYVLRSLDGELDAPFGHAGPCMHEALFSDAGLAEGFSTLDIAKGLIDEGFHPMTVYFPLVVHGAMLVEPTETESKAGLDRFINSLRSLAQRAKAGDESLKSAPHFAPRRRLDETQAARKPVLAWKGDAA